MGSPEGVVTAKLTDVRRAIYNSSDYPDILDSSISSFNQEVGKCLKMHILTLIGIAVALAMDAFAVSIAVGIQLKTIHFRQFFRLSFHFGLFQALMSIIGWIAGLSMRSFVDT